MAELDGIVGIGTAVDPLARDNSIVAIDPGPPLHEDSPPASEPAGDTQLDTIQRELADLRAHNQRYLEQLNGSRAEAQRYEAQLQAERQERQKAAEAQQQLVQQVLQMAQQPRQAEAPPLTLEDVLQQGVLEGNKEIIRRYETQLQQQLGTRNQPATPSVTVDDIRRIAEETSMRRQQVDRLQQALLNDLGARYNDVVSRQDASTLLAQQYALEAQNPIVQALYPPDPSGMASVAYGGATWDVRILERAAQAVRANLAQQGQQTRQQQHTAQTMPATGGGPQTGQPRTSSRTVYLTGAQVAQLKDPVIAAALERATGERDPKMRAKIFFEHLPEDVRQTNLHQAALSRPEVG